MTTSNDSKRGTKIDMLPDLVDARGDLTPGLRGYIDSYTKEFRMDSISLVAQPTDPNTLFAGYKGRAPIERGIVNAPYVPVLEPEGIKENKRVYSFTIQDPSKKINELGIFSSIQSKPRLHRLPPPGLIAYDICGVQPMTGPVGKIFAFRPKYNKQSRKQIKEAKMLKWHARFIQLALSIANWSKDPSTKVGAVVVKDRKIKSTGYNGFPKEMRDDPALYNDREFKLKHIVHAEANAILNSDSSLVGSTMVVTLFPCEQCAQKIVDAGITEVVFQPIEEHHLKRWGDSFIRSRNILEQANVTLTEVKDYARYL